MSGTAAAQTTIDAALYIDVDTSGSMLLPASGSTPCFGDGSVEHPHNGSCQSRIFLAKNALNSTVTGFPEVRWGLARFKQTESTQYLCLCGYQGPAGGAPAHGGQNDVDPSEEPGICHARTGFTYDLPNTIDPICINYGGGFNSGCAGGVNCCDIFANSLNLEGADILVALADVNEDLILSWLDHQEYAFEIGREPTTGNHCWSTAEGAYGNCELRAVGGTPIAGSLQDLYTQLSTIDFGNDPLVGCRPYGIILLTDGDESCSNQASARNAATALRTTPDMNSSCSTSSQCGPNGTCAGGRCEYDVKTHVIAFALSDTTNADQIADRGGTTAAIPANDDAEIQAAMAQIIAESVVAERCNGTDDNCDGQVDEGFGVGTTCDNGLLGACFAQGTLGCDPGDDTATLCNLPAHPLPGDNVEVCDGLDNDCDGLVDEDNVCNCLPADLCNGNTMDDCDPLTPDGSGEPNLGQPCGSSIGACQQGTWQCNAGVMECVGEVAPVAEVCDANVATNDQNCNGVNNDGIAPQPCTKTNAFGSCDGVETCDENGTWICYAQDPAPESCNNIDDNCDGQTDENLSRTCTVTNGLGTCSGTQSCAAGVWSACSAATPAAETCDNVDNDCDGQVDEGLTRACTDSNGFGTCNGVETCNAGIWGGCTAATPAAELCNSVDDDCDGQIDENLTQSCYSGPGGTAGVGECTAGTRTCTGGSYGACVGEVLPTTEICDGKDNDCDGVIDDNLGQTTCGLGACQHTVDNCSGGSPQTCDPLLGQTAESCDGVDNDCDGVVDGLSETCYSSPFGCTQTSPGVWSCTGTCTAGTRTCPVGSGAWGACIGEQGPTGEVCDGQDNDCDGLVDENLLQACYPLGYGPTTGCTAPGSCLGACSMGTQVCASGAWGTCNNAVTPTVETCNNIDDDCDGATDENLQRACQVANAFGTCTGVETCTTGAWGGCTAATPAQETCNNADDNCDGQVDENVTQSCYSGPAGTAGVGACRAGTRTCTAGSFGACLGEVVPQPEVCDGIDNDCDGLVDEDASGQPMSQVCYGGPAGTAGVGVCQTGTRTCSGGNWTACTGAVVPSPEQCDSLDNDCDGQTDEDLGQTTCGLGVCQHTVDNCVSGVPQICDPTAGATAETCDGLDNDCDGIVDGLVETCYGFASGCTETSPGVWSCAGNCAPGRRVCAAGGTGNWSACEFDVGPSPELCDGEDNDCDGLIDNQDAAGSPLSEACYSPGSGPTTGCTFNSTSGTWSCLGECATGVRDCSGGTWTGCTGETTPTIEQCNTLDDDCDGETDEATDIPGLGQPCSNSLGECTPGVLQCINGNEVCAGGTGPFPGDCDGLDNDCDGEIDEPDEVAALEGQACGNTTGSCTEGQTKCVGGSLICTGGTQPSEEICDGVDNDCDGTIDDDAICPPSSHCYQADCRIECDPTVEFPCPGRLVCDRITIGGQAVDICVPGGVQCGGVTCPDGWICQNDVCTDPCAGVNCESWETCTGGVCADTSCTGIGGSCPSGEQCNPLTHACEPDPCAACLDDEVCVEGICFADPCLSAGCDELWEGCLRTCDSAGCTATCEPICVCPDGQSCTRGGFCQIDPCPNGCPAGQTCGETGCEADACFLMSCAPGLTCIDGQCTPDPCQALECPDHARCEIFSDGTGQGEPRCVPLDGRYVPPVQGQTITAIGGGSTCSTAGDGAPLPLVWLLGILGVLWIRRRRRRTRRPFGGAQLALLVAAGGLGLGLGACSLSEYTPGGRGGWQNLDGGNNVVLDGGAADAGDASTCQPTREVCDNADNDCDGVVDNVDASEVGSDPNNCGSCGNVCDFDFAFAGCVGGQCQLGTCLPGHWDLNNDPSDGCEFACLETNGGVETCDGIDNDCDGQADEDFDLQSDPANCGQCYNACAFFQGTGACVSGQCQLSGCVGGYVDKDGNPSNGCECQMRLTEGTVVCDPLSPSCGAGEVCADADADGTSHCSAIPLDGCDGLDDDCDGQIDEDAAVGANQCYTHPVGCTETSPGVFSCTGECRAGNPTCQGGNVICGGQVPPAGEICDNRDNDCNGVVDDGFDKQNDPTNCGGCGVRCSATVQNAIPGCSNGQCTILACQTGYWDIDGLANTGCEYACTLTNGGVEACGDGVDNDCNGVADDGFDLQNDPGNCGSCGHSCSANQPFGTSVTGCSAGNCVYACLPGFWDNNNDLSLGESGNGCEYQCTQSNGGTEICDGLDNDCDGQTDEGFDVNTSLQHCGQCGNDCAANAGTGSTATSCLNGVCQYACQPGRVDLNGDVSLGAAGNGCEYACTVSNGGTEDCDGVDNDCNGDTDEAPGGGALTRACYTGAAITRGVGNCKDGTQTCSGAAWGTCSGEVTPQAETCDNQDNDCDGNTDEDAGGNPLTRPCYTGAPGTESTPPCQQGTQTCSAGVYGGCLGETTPSADVCDGIDNNCNGAIDEDFDLQNDVTNCGSCGNACSASVGPNSATTGCSAGVCQYACQANYYDTNGDLQLGNGGNGCDYYCVLTNGGAEACGDGIDNNCDGEVDGTTPGGMDQCCLDVDQDGFTGQTFPHCPNQGDCNDSDPNVNPYMPEACGDGIDNNCDGNIDEGFDLQNDQDNCGTCGYSCTANTPSGADFVSCSSGTCVYTCQTDQWDVNNDLSLGGAGDGCEYSCTVSNGGTEACDDVDNDCDKLIDEDFAKDTNPLNCGACGNDCSTNVGANSQVLGCVNGVCQYGCVAGWIDLNNDVSAGLAGNGCEYNCTVSNGGVEICDGLDNDCDGQTDEDAGGNPLTRSCYSGTPPGTQGVGLCRAGAETCSAGIWGSCLGEVLPGTEVCDAQDNDCDGSTDEDFDTATDINHCGGCGQSCWGNLPPNAVPSGCVAGSCVYTCSFGWTDLNNDLGSWPAGNGCEYNCGPASAEVCDGLDNDCDGTPDNNISPPAGLCYQGSPGSACDGVGALCQNGVNGWGWYCQYPASVERVPGQVNLVEPQELLCDGLDGDCDNVADDPFNVGATCDDGNLGACRGTGNITCLADMSGSFCDITSAGGSPQAETCDGKDNDCDGLIDETAADPGTNPSYVTDDVVTITLPNGRDVFIYQYEASRPTATGSDQGVGTSSRACSRAGVIPWYAVTYTQAAQACARAGMRLCRADEWFEGCNGTGGGGNAVYPYGDTYAPTACNGHDQDPVSDQVEPTGSQANCQTNGYAGLEDMSGNLREWTMEWTGQDSGNLGIYRLRGGGFRDLREGLQCNYTGASYVQDSLAVHVGFRCCSTCGNGTVDPGESCDGGAGCHPSFCGPTSCGDGVLDAGNGEECDDGNLLPADGCTPACLIFNCGNGNCDGGEDSVTCPADCGAPAPICGDANCDAGETCANCSLDCGTCTACGDGVCEVGENCNNCASDCGACPSCGNGNCELGETDASCPADCGCVGTGSCGGQSPFGCWCDKGCFGRGDCCSNAFQCGPACGSGSCVFERACPGPVGCSTTLYGNGLCDCGCFFYDSDCP